MAEKERTYVFYTCRPGYPDLKEEVTESQLTKPQKDLLFGDFMRRWNELPWDLQGKFMDAIIIGQARLKKKARKKGDQYASVKKK